MALGSEGLYIMKNKVEFINDIAEMVRLCAYGYKVNLEVKEIRRLLV